MADRRDKRPSRHDPDAREVTPGALFFYQLRCISLPILSTSRVASALHVCCASLSTILQHQQGCVGWHACPQVVRIRGMRKLL